MNRSEQRKKFEQWYACNAFDYVRNPIGSRECGLQWAAWQAAQDAVIAKLATVSVEPDLIKTDEVDRYGDSIYIEAYSTEALAAVRVQENERIRKCLEMSASLMDEAAKLIGQIPTDDIEKLSGYRWPLCDELGGAAAIARDEIHALIGGKE